MNRFVTLIAVAACLILVLPVAAQPSLDLAALKQDLSDRILSTGYRDTVFVRVKNGQSCVQASEERATELAYVIRSWQNDGKLGPYGARIGCVSGWNAGVGSMHTYTVVEIYDVAGAVIHTLDADNYLGPVVVSDHGRVNWDATNTKLVVEVRPLKWQTLQGSIEGPSTVAPGEAATFKAGIENPPPFVQYPLSVEWEMDGRPVAVKDPKVSTVLALWAPAAGAHTLVAKIAHKNANNNRPEQLARVVHSFTVTGEAGPKPLSGTWQGTWANSRKQSGPWTIRLEEKNGVVTGTDDGEKILDGKRSGDTMTWSMKTSNGKRWWTETVQIQDDGKTLVAHYTGHDDDGTYTGGGTLRQR